MVECKTNNSQLLLHTSLRHITVSQTELQIHSPTKKTRTSGIHQALLLKHKKNLQMAGAAVEIIIISLRNANRQARDLCQGNQVNSLLQTIMIRRVNMINHGFLITMTRAKVIKTKSLLLVAKTQPSSSMYIQMDKDLILN